MKLSSSRRETKGRGRVEELFVLSGYVNAALFVSNLFCSVIVRSYGRAWVIGMKADFCQSTDLV